MSSPGEAAGFIPPHGNYRELLSYQKAEAIYDITYRFCQRFLTRGDRTVDQMIQAARSGKQNIGAFQQPTRIAEAYGDCVVSLKAFTEPAELHEQRA